MTDWLEWGQRMREEQERTPAAVVSVCGRRKRSAREPGKPHDAVRFWQRESNGRVTMLLHHPEIATHPHHKHIGPAERLAPAINPA